MPDPHPPSHSHGPSGHTPAVSRDNERTVLVAVLITASFMVVELVGGLLSGSLALLADAAHMLTDSAALALAYGAFRLGRRHADDKRTFGYLRLEVIAGLINALTLFGIVAWIALEAWRRFQQPEPVLAGPMLAVAVVGLLVNLLVLRLLTRGDTHHLNLQGAILHVIGDVLGSVAAIVAAVVIALTGWTPIDPLLSLVVSLLILHSAARLFGKAVHILLDGAPAHARPSAIERHLSDAIPEMAAVHHIHVWQITSGRTLATLHVRPHRHSDARLVAEKAAHELKTRFDIEHPTVAIDWTPPRQPSCSLVKPEP